MNDRLCKYSVNLHIRTSIVDYFDVDSCEYNAIYCRVRL